MMGSLHMYDLFPNTSKTKTKIEEPKLYKTGWSINGWNIINTVTNRVVYEI